MHFLNSWIVLATPANISNCMEHKRNFCQPFALCKGTDQYLHRSFPTLLFLYANTLAPVRYVSEKNTTKGTSVSRSHCAKALINIYTAHFHPAFLYAKLLLRNMCTKNTVLSTLFFHHTHKMAPARVRKEHLSFPPVLPPCNTIGSGTCASNVALVL